jgi:hypothetical protein
MAYSVDVLDLTLLTAVEDGTASADQSRIPRLPTLGGTSAAFAGDFYHEPDDIVRGVVLGGIGLDSFAPKYGDWFHSAEDFFEPVELIEPRLAPWGGVASTSLLVPRSSATAAEVATAVEGFLREHASVDVRKVNRQKLSTRAVARFRQLGSCDLKARLFQLPEEDSFAVELARRSGCALAFTEVFRQVARFLVERFEGVRGAHGGAPPGVGDDAPSLVAPPAASPLDKEAYLPLMEAAAGSADPESQVEAIAALAFAGASCAAAAACLGQVLTDGALDTLFRDHRMQVVASAELLAAELAVPPCSA